MNAIKLKSYKNWLFDWNSKAVFCVSVNKQLQGPVPSFIHAISIAYASNKLKIPNH